MMLVIKKTKAAESAIMKNPPRIYRNEEGVAIIMALIMLLVMSVLATTVSFNSNNDFRAMSNYKQGQEAFLAAENCIRQGRNRFEIIGIEVLYFLLQNKDTVILGEGGASDLLVLDEDLENGARCRSGPRSLDSATEGSGQIIEIPPITKTIQRPLKNTSMSTSASGGAGLVPVTFQVTGKDEDDKDIDDVKDTINTGTEVAAGFETFIPGNANQMYSQ
ncbi:MAG TPA: pilus assembly PilX N-terminal domain-containing protein [Thermodesulfobacteriota bacterium]|nr:pilus assembly PilX N-terminal domain-containing protein [Thermodesulfobacteriota bacterium]